MFFFSIHLYDKHEGTEIGNGEFYPGSGREDIPQFNVMNAPILPLWHAPSKPKNMIDSKSKNVFIPHYIQLETVEHGRQHCKVDSVATDHCGYRSQKISADHDQKSNILHNSGRLAFRKHIVSRLLPRLKEFSPNLIFISAGFDAGLNDIGCSKFNNGKHYSGMNLLPEDYAWVTEKIKNITHDCCQGGIISTLEGGYGIWSRQKCVGKMRSGATKKKFALNRSQLGKNALAHCMELIR